ncbi:MAG: acyltransferase [Oscillospiraceae bacterium]|jgi:hypothetical protein
MTGRSGIRLLEREEPVTASRENVRGVDKRNYGIDLLRMLAMVCIIVLHVLGHGGILPNLYPASMGYKLACLLQIVAYCSVNCYAIISGYVCYGTKFKYHRIITLWFQVVFYTLSITLLFRILHPEIIGRLDWIAALLPVAFNQYWYFTAYFCMFFFIPFFNHMMDSLSQRQATCLIFTIILLLSALPTICHADLFQTVNGYSVLWVSGLYFLGAYIKKYQVAQWIGSIRAMVLFLFCILFTWGYKLMMEAGHISPIAFMQDGNDLMSYTSLTILFASVALVLFFSNLKIRHASAVRTIRVLSPSAFSAYLLHTQSMVWFYFMMDRFSWCATLHFWKLIPAVLGISVGIYLCCSGIDFVRRFLFKMLHINGISMKIESGFSKLFEAVFRSMEQKEKTKTSR